MTYLELSFTFFVIVLSKVILGLVACWMLMPRDDECPTCNARMLPMAARNGRQRIYRLLQLQLRWCMECGGEVVGRTGTPPSEPVSAQAPRVTARWSQ